MRLQYIILVVGLLVANCCSAQNIEVLRNIAETGRSIKDFIPAGYDTLTTAKGDLNKDKLDDIVLVLYAVENKVAGADTLPRIFAVLFGKEGEYILAAKSDKIVAGYGGDPTYPPYVNISVGKGILAIQQIEGQSYKGESIDRFRYQKSNFYRIGYARNEYKTNVECENVDFPGRFEDVNLLTGERHRMKISDETCKVLLDKKDKIKIRPLVKLADFSIEE